jgi:hypothetical protein
MEKEKYLKKVCHGCDQEFDIRLSDFEFYCSIDSPFACHCSKCKFVKRISEPEERSSLSNPLK